MVVNIGNKNILVKPHSNEKTIVTKKPTELYLGKEWADFNKNK